MLRTFLNSPFYKAHFSAPLPLPLPSALPPAPISTSPISFNPALIPPPAIRPQMSPSISAPALPTLSPALLTLSPARSLAPYLLSPPPPSTAFSAVDTAAPPNSTLALYSRPSPHHPHLAEFLCVGTAPVAARHLRAAIADPARPSWDTSCTSLSELSSSDDRGTARTTLHWETKYPFPLAGRDYVFERVEERDGACYFLATAALEGALPKPKKKCVRVECSSSAYVVEEISDAECRFVYSIVDDPKMTLPQSVVNYVTKKTLPTVLAELYRQAAGFRDRESGSV